MSRNRNQVQKLQDQQRERPALLHSSTTPRTDSFARLQLHVRLKMAQFRNYESLIEVDHEIRKLMEQWAAFARELEEDLNDVQAGRSE